MKNIIILGGGTFSYVRNHLALAAPAFGNTARQLDDLFENIKAYDKYNVILKLTKMASSSSDLVTNEDVEKYIDKLIADKNTRAIIFNVAMTDFNGSIDNISGKYAERLETKAGNVTMNLTPSEKIISKIRKERKDIFVVGFKTTCNQSSQTQYLKGLNLLKSNSLNLVLANDTVTHNNMIIAPEETRYSETTNRQDALAYLVKMVMSRLDNTFTRSTVVESDLVKWHPESVNKNLFEVVNHCIAKGAYKPFNGKTAGHFASKVSDTEIITSIRKSNFNNLASTGMVKIESKDKDSVIAYGAKPSVGGQSQRIIFSHHKDVDNIIHFHVTPKNKQELIELQAVRDQWKNECGSHECGQNTSNGLKRVDLGDGDYLKVVYLDDHGPNIVFNKTVPSSKVIKYIDKTFDLTSKTGGLFNAS